MQSASRTDASSSMQNFSFQAHACDACAGSTVLAEEHTNSCRRSVRESRSACSMLYDATFFKASFQSSTGSPRDRNVLPSSSRGSLRREYSDRDNDRMPQNSRLASYRPVSQLPEVCLPSLELNSVFFIHAKCRPAMYAPKHRQVALKLSYKHAHYDLQSQGCLSAECSMPEVLPLRRSQQPGRFVRIAACLPGEQPPTKLVPTWTTQGVIELDHVVYPLFNKPWALTRVS